MGKMGGIIEPEALVNLRDVYSGLNPATRKVADYIIAHPYDVLETSIVRLSEQIKVSQFSIISCVKKAGYKGIKDFKIALACSLSPNASARLETIAPEDDAYRIYKKVTQWKIHSLSETLRHMDEAGFCKAVDMIGKAERIEIYARGSSFYAADFLNSNLRRLDKHSSLYRDPNYQRMGAALLKQGDLAIGVAASGDTRSVEESLETAKQNEAATLAITASKNAPISDYADVTLVTMPVEPPSRKVTNYAVTEQVTLASALTIALSESRNSVPQRP